MWRVDTPSPAYLPAKGHGVELWSIARVDEVLSSTAGREWSNPPLWGIGLQETVNGHRLYLHGGRACDLMEAILWNGGEGAGPRDTVLELPASDREHLTAYLNSL